MQCHSAHKRLGGQHPIGWCCLRLLQLERLRAKMSDMDTLTREASANRDGPSIQDLLLVSCGAVCDWCGCCV